MSFKEVLKGGHCNFPLLYYFSAKKHVMFVQSHETPRGGVTVIYSIRPIPNNPDLGSGKVGILFFSTHGLSYYKFHNMSSNLITILIHKRT